MARLLILFLLWVTLPGTSRRCGCSSRWSLGGGMIQLAKDFKGPADFCVMGDTVYVPDLVKSEMRIVRLGK